MAVVRLLLYSSFPFFVDSSSSMVVLKADSCCDFFSLILSVIYFLIFFLVDIKDPTVAILSVLAFVGGTRRNIPKFEEIDLHTKRTGHMEFADKTSEAAKPISLEAPKPKYNIDMEATGDGVSSSSSKREGASCFHQQTNKFQLKINYLKEAMSRGFSILENLSNSMLFLRSIFTRPSIGISQVELHKV